MTTRPGSAPDKVIVDVRVVEQPTGSLSLGGSYGVSAGFGAVISFSEDNFLGRGQSIGVDLNTTRSDANASFRFSEPALLGRDLKFSLGAGLTTSTHSYANYDTRKLFFNPGIEFPIAPRARLGLNYRLARDKLRNVDAGASAILHREAGSRVASSLGYSYSFNSNADGLSPDRFVTLRFGQDIAGLGGQAKYIKTTGEVAYETKLLRQSLTVRAEFAAGALTMLQGQSSTVTERFSLNGRMIGFRPNGAGPRDLTASVTDGLGGNYFAVARVETRFPLGLPQEYGINGGLFMDVGSVWGLNDKQGTAGPVDDRFHPRVTAGFSVFWKTPVGPLRFNFSRALVKQPYDRPQAFDFTISTRF